MTNASIRTYADAHCRQLKTETPISRTAAMEAIRTGFRAARDLELGDYVSDDDELWKLARWIKWAGYEPYQVAAPLGQQHVTRIRLRPDVGPYRYEYVFPGGLSTAECDDLWHTIVAEDGMDESDQEREWLVTGTLAGVLHAGGVSLQDHVVSYAYGRTVGNQGLTVIPPNPPTTLSATVRDRGWSKTADWLHEIQAMLEQCLDARRNDRAVWLPMAAPRSPWEPLVLRSFAQGGCLRLALNSAEAAAYTGRREELTVSAADRCHWLTDREAERVSGMSNGQWRRWIEIHKRVRVGRPVAHDGRAARNRRLIHKGDLRYELRLARNHGEDICVPSKCKIKCDMARYCPHRDHHCPG